MEQWHSAATAMVAVSGGGVAVAMVKKRMIQARWKDQVASKYGERTSTRSVQFDVFLRENFADKNGINGLYINRC